ncbi:MAG TPA: TlpA disulfide reductase family protein [Bacteroidales bacterium]|jgi:thiol-disulfide isomerase/thioredoxin|nr:TlpA disulfide reductase family protein [Bacteroidales bacterium]MDD4235211.1 TlpA disulfide reductase family protein [Bacteroidales bacterium]MDY0161513.1 TlpA disulfide reductase family protein [Bacteroidales bacterium]HXK81924.1 TlpA disulfide reductase family protein [Bacteroidales bacterium]
MKTLVLLVSVMFYFSILLAQPEVKTGTGIGDLAPEIELKTPEGETVKLSSLRGKLVLIDFWASWCGPCRRENPLVLKAYKEYKDKNFSIGKGFSIYGVSLDKSREQWIAGINKDSLIWTNVSDLQYWNSSPVKEYGVRSIPANFLIDKDGVIIAKNLRGTRLEETLKKYVILDPLVELNKNLEKLNKSFQNVKDSPDYMEQEKLLKKIEKKLFAIEKSINAIKSKNDL